MKEYVQNINELIKIYVLPLLDEECKRLGIPRNFVKSVDSQHYRLEMESRLEHNCEEIYDKNGKLIGVNIRLEDRSNRRELLAAFFHEMFHAKELIYGDKFLSGLRAKLYAEKRILQLALSGWRYLKK